MRGNNKDGDLMTVLKEDDERDVVEDWRVEEKGFEKGKRFRKKTKLEFAAQHK